MTWQRLIHIKIKKKNNAMENERRSQLHSIYVSFALYKYAGSSDRQHLVRGVGHVWLAVRTKERKGKREKGKKTWQTYADFAHPWCGGGEATSFPTATSAGKAKTMPSVARVHSTLAQLDLAVVPTHQALTQDLMNLCRYIKHHTAMQNYVIGSNA